MPPNHSRTLGISFFSLSDACFVGCAFHRTPVEIATSKALIKKLICEYSFINQHSYAVKVGSLYKSLQSRQLLSGRRFIVSFDTPLDNSWTTYGTRCLFEESSIVSLPDSSERISITG